MNVEVPSGVEVTASLRKAGSLANDNRNGRWLVWTWK